MSTFGSNSVAFALADGYNLLGAPLKEVTDETEAILDDLMGLGDIWPRPYPAGLKRVKLGLKGVYEDSNAWNTPLIGIGASRYIAYGVEGNTIGKQFIGWEGQLIKKYDRLPSVPGLIKSNVEFEGAAAVDVGRILHAYGTETTASGNTQGTSVDNGAGSSASGVVHAHVTALTLGGYTSASLVVQHSTDNASWADLGSSTVTFTTAPTATLAIPAATINRYLAMRWVFNGAGSGPLITFMLGFKRG